MNVERKAGMAIAFLFSHSGFSERPANGRRPFPGREMAASCQFGTRVMALFCGPMQNSQAIALALEMYGQLKFLWQNPSY
jgi:hypothetical protein